MPEGDTIRRLANRIQATFAGQVVGRSVMRDPRLIGIDLAGHTLLDADAYGKHLFVRFDDGRSLHAHLLMDGRFTVGPASREPEWKRRLELWLASGRLTAEQVPLLGFIATPDEHEIIDHLGPDLCAVAGPPDVDEVVARLQRDSFAPLTGALLDQRNVAGFGNVYVTELPFICGVSPFRPVGEVGDLDRLVALGTAMIRVNAERGPQNTTGRRLDTPAHFVYAKARRPCPVCGSRLEYRDGDHTPWQRSITWCPSCQSGDAVDDARLRRLVALHPAIKR